MCGRFGSARLLLTGIRLLPLLRSFPMPDNDNHPGTNSGYPDNPILVRVWRGAEVESVHRGAWVLVDPEGGVIDGAGSFRSPVFARSTVKALQALPLFETGAADRFNFGPEQTALAISSHNAEPCHTDVVRAMLERLELGEEHLRCGAQVAGDRETRWRMLRADEKPTSLHNNCSGKHAGFLTLSRFLEEEPASYLDVASKVQSRVRKAVTEMCGLSADELVVAIDGCSAPTFRMPLVNLALGFARLSNPDKLDADRANWCRVLQDSVAAHPELVAGNAGRIDTDISRATKGRLFPKVGAEGVYVIGEVDGGRALAVKLDDGGLRGMHRLIIGLIEKLGMASGEELEQLARWRNPIVRNFAGLEVGREEVLV